MIERVNHSEAGPKRCCSGLEQYQYLFPCSGILFTY